MSEYRVGPPEWQAPPLNPRETVVCWEIEEDSKKYFSESKITEEITRASLYEVIWQDKKSSLRPKLSLIPVTRAYGFNINILQRLFPEGRTDSIYLLHKGFTPKDRRVIFTATEIGTILDFPTPVGFVLKDRRGSLRHPHFEYQLLEMADGTQPSTTHPLIALIEKEIDHSKMVADDKSSKMFARVDALQDEEKFELFKFAPYKFKYPAYAAVIPYMEKTIIFASSLNTTSSYLNRHKNGVAKLRIKENGDANDYEIALPGISIAMYDLVKRLSAAAETHKSTSPVSSIHPENLGTLGMFLIVEATRRIVDPDSSELSLHEIYGTAPTERLGVLGRSINTDVFPKFPKKEIPELDIEWCETPLSGTDWKSIDNRIPLEFAGSVKWDITSIEGSKEEGSAKIRTDLKKSYLYYILKWSQSSSEPMEQFEIIKANIEAKGTGTGESLDGIYDGHTTRYVQGYEVKNNVPTIIAARFFHCENKERHIVIVVMCSARSKSETESGAGHGTGLIRCHDS